MLYLRHIPAPPLNEFVECFWHIADSPLHAKEQILPSGTTELVINLDADEIEIQHPEQSGRGKRLSGAVVSGPYSRPFDTRRFCTQGMGIN